jgi:hypothetical protein
VATVASSPASKVVVEVLLLASSTEVWLPFPSKPNIVARGWSV